MALSDVPIWGGMALLRVLRAIAVGLSVARRPPLDEATQRYVDKESWRWQDNSQDPGV